MKKEKFDCGEWNIKKENGETLVVGDHYVARIHDWRGFNPPNSKENAELHAEAEANARLIASAPEMLIALKHIEHNLSELSEENFEHELAHVRYAISKALGE